MVVVEVLGTARPDGTGAGRTGIDAVDGTGSGIATREAGTASSHVGTGIASMGTPIGKKIKIETD